MLSALVALVMTPNALQTYIAKPQASYGWKVTSESAKRRDLRLTSQSWQGTTWTHDLIEISAGKPLKADTAVLVVTGDRVDRADIPFAEKISARSRLPVWTLFQIPNQPLFEKREDDLIAYSFAKYLQTGESDWPLLLPMVNSVSKAMDAIEEATHHKVKRFIVTGVSKRGWTTWLCGAVGDPRVVAIAPVAFDFLNMPAQLKHQFESWGKFSEMLHDYTDEELQEQTASEGGQRLVGIVDPYSYRSAYSVPTLAIRGANDRYWTVDAMNLYWEDMHQPKSFLNLPNEGHDFAHEDAYLDALGAFAAAQAGAFHWPNELRSTVDCRLVRTVTMSAGAEGLDFRDSVWGSGDAAGTHSANYEMYYFEAKGGYRFSLSSPVRVH